jgi:hypothetical protein
LRPRAPDRATGEFASTAGAMCSTSCSTVSASCQTPHVATAALAQLLTAARTRSTLRAAGMCWYRSEQPPSCVIRMVDPAATLSGCCCVGMEPRRSTRYSQSMKHSCNSNYIRSDPAIKTMSREEFRALWAGRNESCSLVLHDGFRARLRGPDTAPGRLRPHTAGRASCCTARIVGTQKDAALHE